MGTIARSGSKIFVEEMSKMNKEGSAVVPEAIIGQFGVGFYSAFMVANKIDVFSKSSREGSVALHWTSDGHGTYDIDEAENQDMEPGTKVVIQLKENCAGDMLAAGHRGLPLMTSRKFGEFLTSLSPLSL